jgi:hypothetical protein
VGLSALYLSCPRTLTDLLNGAGSSLRSLQLLSYWRISQYLMDPEGSLPYSKQRATGTCPEPDETRKFKVMLENYSVLRWLMVGILDKGGLYAIYFLIYSYCYCLQAYIDGRNMRAMCIFQCFLLINKVTYLRETKSLAFKCCLQLLSRVIKETQVTRFVPILRLVCVRVREPE